MKIVVGGVATETNTFSPIPTGLADFDVIRGDARTASYQQGMLDAVKQHAAKGGHTLVNTVLAFAQPAGLTVRPAYEALRDEMLEGVRAHANADVVLLLLHGAMVADGYTDCELDMLTRVRDVVGPDAVIGAVLDPHCHLDQHLLDAADIIVCYKEYPHTDVIESTLRALDLCLATRRGEVCPVAALFDCAMLGMYNTKAEPMRGEVAAMRAAEASGEALSLSFVHGFPWGDVPHAGSKMLAVCDGDKQAAETLARRHGERLYGLRHALSLKALDLDTAMRTAVEAAADPSQCPVVVADQSDNAGGGAPADSTFALRWLLDNGVRDAGVANLYDPEVVKLAKAAGPGAQLPVRLGGKTAPVSGDPLDLTVRVVGILPDSQHAFPQEDGSDIRFPLGDVAALECDGVFVIVSSRRSQCFTPQIFADVGLDDLKILVPKSTNHFLSGFGPVAGKVIYMAAPGAIPPIMTAIDFQHMPTADKFPWVDDPLGLDNAA